VTLNELLNKQKELDNLVLKTNNDLIAPKQILTSTILALIVEIGEMANEIRCFKHWSKKPSSKRVIILEEYVDALHFFLSIANQLGFNEQDIVEMYNTKYNKNIERQLSNY